MGLTVNVYRWALGDCTNNGVSSRATQLCVVNVPGPTQPNRDKPAVALVENGAGLVRLVPVIGDDDEGWQLVEPDGYAGPMMGGNYAATGDGRFEKAIEEITGARFYGAVAVHDRYEYQGGRRWLA